MYVGLVTRFGNAIGNAVWSCGSVRRFGKARQYDGGTDGSARYGETRDSLQFSPRFAGAALRMKVRNSRKINDLREHSVPGAPVAKVSITNASAIRP